MSRTLKETLKEIQILLGSPHRKIAGSLRYYLEFLNVPENMEKEMKITSKKENIHSISHKKITWTDVVNPNRKAIAELAKDYPFHPLHLEDCISKVQFPKIEQSVEDKYLFLLFRFPSYQTGEGKIIINQVCFFLGKNYIVTLHEDATYAISDMFEDCLENIEQREVYMNGSSAHLIYAIMDQLTNDFSPLLQSILKELDETEDIVFDDKVSGVYKIGQLRQKIISLRRVIGPLKLLISDLADRINNFTPGNLSVYFEDILHRIEKAWETLEEARETIEIYKDADFTISTEKTSRILAVLTIIFTLSIPATVVGTLFGMNVLIPGGIESGNWTFLGRYTTFIMILIVAVIPAVAMYLYFKKRGWF